MRPGEMCRMTPCGASAGGRGQPWVMLPSRQRDSPSSYTRAAFLPVLPVERFQIVLHILREHGLLDPADSTFQCHQPMNACGIVNGLNPQPCFLGTQLTERLGRIHTDLLQLLRHILTDVGQLLQLSHVRFTSLLLMTRPVSSIPCGEQHCGLAAPKWPHLHSAFRHDTITDFIRLYQ